MRQLTFAMPIDYARATGGYNYARSILAELDRLGWRVSWLDLPAGFPFPGDEAVARTAALLASVPAGTVVLADQLCLSVIPDVVDAAAARVQLVFIVHHLIEIDWRGTPDVAERLLSSERRALRHARLIITTSAATAQSVVSEAGIEEGRIVVAPPGVAGRPLASARDDQVIELLSVGAVIPRKRHELIVEALSEVRSLPWRLEIVGDVGRAPDHVALVRGTIARLGLADRIVLTGELSDEELDARWRRASVLVSGSRHEGYGMAIAEAIAHGIPVVTTDSGAIGEWVAPGAAHVAAANDEAAFKQGLRRVLVDAAYRAELRRAAVAARARLPSWEASARIVSDALSPLLPGAPAGRTRTRSRAR